MEYTTTVQPMMISRHLLDVFQNYVLITVIRDTVAEAYDAQCNYFQSAFEASNRGFMGFYIVGYEFVPAFRNNMLFPSSR